MASLLGYARVSTTLQDPALQVDALNAAGCYAVYTDVASGATTARPQLEQVLGDLRPGDSVVVWRLDRLGRSVRDLINTITDLSARDVAFVSLTEGIDTTTPTGRFVLTILAGMAEMERELVRERTLAGLAAARAAGKYGGRPRALSQTKVRRARQLRKKGMSYAEIGASLGVHATTIRRYLLEVAVPAATPAPAGPGDVALAPAGGAGRS